MANRAAELALFWESTGGRPSVAAPEWAEGGEIDTVYWCRHCGHTAQEFFHAREINYDEYEHAPDCLVPLSVAAHKAGSE